MMVDDIQIVSPPEEPTSAVEEAPTAKVDWFEAPTAPRSPPPPLKARPQPARAPPSPPPDTGPVDVDVSPPASSTYAHPDTEAAFADRYLAYSPHSGYHNQRISLENALTLAFLLKRTLLLPPVWLGHAIPYISFDKLQRRLEMASKEGLEHCIEFGEGSNEDPIPRECAGFWDWTTVDWSWLVDLSEADKLVPLKRRANLSTEWLHDELGLRKADKRGDSPDVWRLKDDTMYQYRFYDSEIDQEPLDKWGNRLDVDKLRDKTDSFKLVHVGSMFGTNRLRVTRDDSFSARSIFRKSMVFRTDVVDEVTQQVRDLLGGEGNYYGLHLRVGDGIFQQNAPQNMRGVWDKQCKDKMGLDIEFCDEVRRTSETNRLARRGLEVDLSYNSTVAKRSNSRPQRAGAYKHAPLPPLPTVHSRSDSLLSSELACRSPLHIDERFLPFNAPLFIATDSKLPHADPNLAVFFDAFPCTFVLSDFSSLPSISKLNRLRNKDDKTPLAQFLYPQLDAQIAAWGRGLVGTPQSTYSRFAIDVLHQVYHGWDIVERG
ncbi:cigA protein [Rhodotorula toruloides]|uniref:CigA protein n=1 Tax=Rhodotorula toruloides TaxID=5286 RepID=A0A511KNL5_RHOTO|nr:cigA protein [Rhodotorula toruloides]